MSILFYTILHYYLLYSHINYFNAFTYFTFLHLTPNPFVWVHHTLPGLRSPQISILGVRAACEPNLRGKGIPTPQEIPFLLPQWDVTSAGCSAAASCAEVRKTKSQYTSMNERSYMMLSTPAAGLLLLSAWIFPSYALYFHIGETEKKCFIEEIPDETMVIGKLLPGMSLAGRS